MKNTEEKEHIIERMGIKMISAGGLTHPGAHHIDSSHYDDEIKLFNQVLDNVEDHEPVMIEVGSFWAWWSLMFRKRFNKGKNILIEYAKTQLRCGERNFELNKCSYVSYHAGMAISHTTQKGVKDLGNNITLSQVIKENKISTVDVLHMDIQGSELEALKSMSEFLENRTIRQIVIGTHNHLVGYDVHESTVRHLMKYKYKLIKSIRNSTDDGYIHAAAPDLGVRN